MNSVHFISFIGLIQTSLLSLALLFIIKKWRVHTCYFFAFQVVLFLVFLRSFFASSGILHNNPQYIGWGLWVLLLAAPLAHFYMQSTLVKGFRLSKFAWLHFIPAMLGAIFSVLMLMEDPTKKTVMLTLLLNEGGMVEQPYSYLFWVFHAEKILFYLQVPFYWWCSRDLLNAKVVDSKKLKPENFLFNWMKTIRFSVVVLFMSEMTFNIVGYILSFNLFPLVTLLSHMIMLIIVLSTFFFPIKFVVLTLINKDDKSSELEPLSIDNVVELLAEDVIEHDDNVTIPHTSMQNETVETTNNKYEKSKLNLRRIKQISNKFDALMNEEKYYLNDELSLTEVAAQLECSANHLSQTINTVYKKSFTELISTMRIDEAKERLKMQPDVTVLEICFAVGFQSKSAFYKAFKKHTNLTPSQYKKLQTQPVAKCK